MTKTFVVIGFSGYGLDETSEVMYAGEFEEKAREYNIDSMVDKLSLEVWENGLLRQVFAKNEIYDWTLKYDRLKDGA